MKDAAVSNVGKVYLMRILAVSMNEEFCIQNGELCIQNEELCI